jgi:hypothetical protein
LAAPTAVAVACSTDAIAGAWIIRASHGMKKVEPCRSRSRRGVAPGSICVPLQDRGSRRSLLSLTGVIPPAAPGSYAWSVVVVPRSKPDAAYELRAIVPVPHVAHSPRQLRLGDQSRTAHRHASAPRQATAADGGRHRASRSHRRSPCLLRLLGRGCRHDAAGRIHDLTCRWSAPRGSSPAPPPTVKRCSGPSRAPAGCKTVDDRRHQRAIPSPSASLDEAAVTQKGFPDRVPRGRVRDVSQRLWDQTEDGRLSTGSGVRDEDGDLSRRQQARRGVRSSSRPRAKLKAVGARASRGRVQLGVREAPESLSEPASVTAERPQTSPHTTTARPTLVRVTGKRGTHAHAARGTSFLLRAKLSHRRSVVVDSVGPSVP